MVQISENYCQIDWRHLLQSCEIEQTAIEKTFAQLADAYSTPGRYYHTLEHIHHVLETVKTLQNQAQDITAVEFAAWFHDVIYDTRASDNEEQSANFAVELLTSLGVANSLIANVNRLILNTKLHQADINDFDGHILLDADLAILGSNPENYQKYALAIRQEYAWVPDMEYIVGRQGVLERFLKRPRIYFTQVMFNALEASARNNIKAEFDVN
jgi:predicted metal-dependent HD superfamily phosphohydrolase